MSELKSSSTSKCRTPSFFGHPVEAMSKTTFYFVIVVLVLVDVIQGRYQKKLMAKKEERHGLVT